MSLFYQFLFLVLTYFIAAIPFGLILVKIFVKKDVRDFGSKNIGATNVVRVAGKKLGFVTFLLDGLKGALMVIFARFAFYDLENLHLFLVVIAATAVMAHIYPVYLKFKGGKGVATAIAVLFALDASVGFLSVCFWIMSFCLFRISAVSSIVAITSSILISANFDAPKSQIIFCCFLTILILVRHKENILRLMMGEEKRI